MRGMKVAIWLAVAATAMCGSAAGQDAGKAVKLEVDLREAPRRVYHAKMTLPVKPGPLTLVYPKWIPGEHAPNGPIVDVTGVKFSANRNEVRWQRDPGDMYAFECTVPTGAETLDVQMDYLLP